jgi:hypothetical protein
MNIHPSDVCSGEPVNSDPSYTTAFYSEVMALLGGFDTELDSLEKDLSTIMAKHPQAVSSGPEVDHEPRTELENMLMELHKGLKQRFMRLHHIREEIQL